MDTVQIVADRRPPCLSNVNRVTAVGPLVCRTLAESLQCPDQSTCCHVFTQTRVCYARRYLRMSILTEQRVYANFVLNCKKKKKFTEIFEILQKVSGGETKSHTRPYEWYRKFKDGRTSIEDDPRSGRRSPSTDDDSIGLVRAVTRSNRRSTMWKAADKRVISVWSCHIILPEKLNMHRVAAKRVPWLLTDEQKEERVAICQELLLRANYKENFLKNIVTGNETWIF